MTGGRQPRSLPWSRQYVKGGADVLHAVAFDFGWSAQGHIPQSTQSTLAKVKEFVFGL